MVAGAAYTRTMACPHKHVLITGTSSGIGKATMEAALAAGYHVLAGDRSAEPPPGGVIPDGEMLTRIRLDITRQDQIDAAVALVADHVGSAGLDALANIAGIGIPGPLETMPLDDLRLSFDVDFFGQMALAQPCIPLLRMARGRLVFVGSVIDRTTVPFFGALASSKSAIAAAAGTLRQELAPWGIAVVLVEPGFISTGADEATKARIDALIDGFSPAEAALYGDMFRTATERGYKVQTSGSSPDGVAQVIVHAMQARRPKARYLTGSKARTMTNMGRLPIRIQDAVRRRAFGLPGPGTRP